MDPTQAAAMLQGTQGGAAAPQASPQALATIQNLMKSPGGMGAMPPMPNQMAQPPAQVPTPPMPQPQGNAMQGMANPAMAAQQQQQLMQLLNQQPQPISP